MDQTVSKQADRPISPHLMQYRWGIHMMASIVHRITGFILATAGLMTLVWWLTALSGGAESYSAFTVYVINAGENATGLQMACNWFFRIAAFAVVYSFFQHFFSGLRHLLMDIGAGFELKTNRIWSQAVFVLAFFATAATALFVYTRVTGA